MAIQFETPKGFNKGISISVSQPSACTLNGQSIAHGSSATAYQSSSVAFGNTCQSQSRTCSNGSLGGSYQYSACSISPVVFSVYPADNQSSVSLSIDNITVTFSLAMDTSTITTNISITSCSGTLQVSSDNFISCVRMSPTPTASNSNKTFKGLAV